MVRQQRHGRSARLGFRLGRGAQALRMSRLVARPQGGGVLPSDGALARPVQRRFRRAALRSDQHLTSTYFEVNASDLPEVDKRRHGYSRDKRPDCPQLVIALVVTAEGLPLAYEVLPGNTADSKTLRTFLSKIEKQYGKARRVWVMDRGVPTEAVLAEMRASDPPVQYLVGTPKGRLNRLEKHLIEKPWQKARAGVEVKLLAQDDELYVFAQSADRVVKERAMRRRQLKWLWTRLGKLASMNVKREEMLMKLGAARSKAPTAWRMVDVALDKDTAALS